MPTIKIVPMPGISVPGPQGPVGPQGSTGPSGLFEAVRVETGAYIQQETTNMSFVVYPPLSSGWSIGQRVRLWHTDLQGLHVDGTIDYIAAEFRDSFGIVIDTYNLSGMDTLEYDMTLLTDSLANTGNFQFNANTISTDEDMTITVNGVPGKVNIGGYLGVDLQFANTPGAGLKFPDDTVQTTAYPGPQALFPEPVDWTPVMSGDGFTQFSNLATGTYMKYGRMVVVNMFVPFTNVTNFGTGQYSVTLPFPALNHLDVFAGSVHNTGPTTDHYSLKGHLSDGSSTMTLWYISGSSKDEPFKSNAPINLNTTDLFHMHFIYETAS
jgi:hypothetical protein